MLMYVLGGICLIFYSQNPSFSFAAISPGMHHLLKLDIISGEEEASKEGESKPAVTLSVISQFLHSDNNTDGQHSFIVVFLKQIAILHFSLRSPPYFCA